jgi:hypothetical protein
MQSAVRARRHPRPRRSRLRAEYCLVELAGLCEIRIQLAQPRSEQSWESLVFSVPHLRKI